MAPTIARLPSLTLAAISALESTFNGLEPREIDARIRAGELALLEAELAGDVSYAIVSREGHCARIEALAGRNGMYLARRIVDAARAAGLTCDAWVRSRSLVRLTGRIGMRATGEVYGSQYRVLA